MDPGTELWSVAAVEDGEGLGGLVDGSAEQSCWVPIARYNGLTKSWMVSGAKVR